jgi:hypothetical protein
MQALGHESFEGVMLWFSSYRLAPYAVPTLRFCVGGGVHAKCGDRLSELRQSVGALLPSHLDRHGIWRPEHELRPVPIIECVTDFGLCL